MAELEERARILTMLEAGQINPEQAARLLEVISTGNWPDREASEPAPESPREEDLAPDFDPPGTAGQAAAELSPPPAIPPEMRKWRSYWIGVFLVATGALILSAFLMYWALESRGYGFWFFCSWLPFMLSVAAVALAWQSRTLPWLHLRVEQPANEWPRRIAISFPLPLGVAGWAVRTFGNRIPGLDRTGLEVNEMDRFIYGLGEYTSSETPLFIEIDEASGDHVLIYIG
jgi:hypothetical protein